jgi:glycosyltransferase involved in cell wall biosynthesis
MSASLSLYREFRTEPASITWFVLPEAYLIGTSMAILSRLPSPAVMSRRSLSLYQHKYPGVRWLERAFHRRMSLVLANSLAVARQLRDDEGVSPACLRVVYNGIDLDRFDSMAPPSETRSALGVRADAFVMIVVANLIPYKGHADLLQALHLARHRLPVGWRLLCAGSGVEYEEKLRAIADELGLGKHVLWLGSRHDVPNLLAASDLGLLPSHEEGFSNALLEGMAAGLPMIATDVGGNPEAVSHGQTGYIVPPHSPIPLADAIVDLADDIAKRRRFGMQGRARILKYFSLANCVDKYDRLFSALAGSESLPAPEDLGLPEIADAGVAKATGPVQ